MSDCWETIQKEARAHGWEWASKSKSRINAFGQWLKTEGTLRGIIGPRESRVVESRHLLNSLSLLRGPEVVADIQRAGGFFDFGTGGGLPGFVLWLTNPDLRAVLVDSQQKRLDFIAEFVASQDLPEKNLELIHDRIEQAGFLKTWREQAEVVISRAFLPPWLAFEWGFLALKPGTGKYYLMAGEKEGERLTNLRNKFRDIPLSIEETSCGQPPDCGAWLLIARREEGPAPRDWPRAKKTIKMEWETKWEK